MNFDDSELYLNSCESKVKDLAYQYILLQNSHKIKNTESLLIGFKFNSELNYYQIVLQTSEKKFLISIITDKRQVGLFWDLCVFKHVDFYLLNDYLKPLKKLN